MCRLCYYLSICEVVIMIIECAKKDMLCFAFKMKDGAEPVSLNENQSMVFRCAVDCAESTDNPDGKTMLEIEGIAVTEPQEEGSNDTPAVIPGLYAFIADLNHINGHDTQVIPGRYPFEVRVVTEIENDNTYHQTIAFEQDNALIIHKGATV